MKNEVIRLITTTKTRNNRGFEETVETKSREIFACEESVGIVEKYEAQKAGADVSIILEVDSLEYEDASEGARPDSIEYNGRTYQVYDVRKKRNSTKTTEIVCRG